jgi:hypothetical protein
MRVISFDDIFFKIDNNTSVLSVSNTLANARKQYNSFDSFAPDILDRIYNLYELRKQKVVLWDVLQIVSFMSAFKVHHDGLLQIVLTYKFRHYDSEKVIIILLWGLAKLRRRVNTNMERFVEECASILSKGNFLKAAPNDDLSKLIWAMSVLQGRMNFLFVKLIDIIQHVITNNVYRFTRIDMVCILNAIELVLDKNSMFDAAARKTLVSFTRCISKYVSIQGTSEIVQKILHIQANEKIQTSERPESASMDVQQKSIDTRQNVDRILENHHEKDEATLLRIKNRMHLLYETSGEEYYLTSYYRVNRYLIIKSAEYTELVKSDFINFDNVALVNA